jgi:phosphomannomutase
MGIFKAYDVRGVYPSEVNESLFFDIGRIFADMIKEESKKERPVICVGMDMRLSSPSLKKSLIQGIINQGADVADIGLVSTPSFYFAVGRFSYDAGMIVSASHNPKEYNGLKIVKAKAFPVGYDSGLNEIEKRLKGKIFADSDKKGEIIFNDKILNEEINFFISKFDISSFKNFKVVADTANSMGSQFLSALFEKIPSCTFVRMNFDLDGSFPSHPPDPLKNENVAELEKKVVEENADFGIATDGDGDRIFFVDNKGKTVEPAVIRGILSKIILKEFPGSVICYDIRPGKITEDMILENNGKPYVTKVGHSLIKAKGIELGAKFAGESSGHFFFDSEFGFFEMPVLVVLEIMKKLSCSGISLFDYVEPLRKKYFHSGEINSIVEDKEAAIKKIAEIFSDGKISYLDGITVEFPDFWFNIRASNTENLLRLNLEAVSKDLMVEKRDYLMKIINS